MGANRIHHDINTDVSALDAGDVVDSSTGRMEALESRGADGRNGIWSENKEMVVECQWVEDTCKG